MVTRLRNSIHEGARDGCVFLSSSVLLVQSWLRLPNEGRNARTRRQEGQKKMKMKMKTKIRIPTYRTRQEIISSATVPPPHSATESKRRTDQPCHHAFD